MLRELKTFLAVVRYGSFASAGSRVGLTQSAVSAQMQKLEEALGTPLFDRTGRSAVLNAAGREAIPLSEQILNLFEQMHTRVNSPVLRGVLRIGAVQTAQVGLLPETLATLHVEHPQVSVRAVPGSSLYLLGQVDSSDIDAALIVKPTFDLPPEMFWLPLLREPFMMIAARNEPLDDWRELLIERPYVRYDRNSFGGRVVETFLKRQQLQTHDSIEVQDIDAIVRMVSRGLGVSFVPVLRPRVLAKTVKVIGLGEQTFYREVGLVARAEGETRELVRCFVQSLKAAVRDLPGAHPDLDMA